MPFELPLAEDNRSGTPHPRVHRAPPGPASSTGSLLLCCPPARAPARAPAGEGTSSPNTQPASAPDATVSYTVFPGGLGGKRTLVTGQWGQHSIFVAASDTGAGKTVPPWARFHESRSKRGWERTQISSVSHPAARSQPGRPDEEQEEEEEGRRAREGRKGSGETRAGIRECSWGGAHSGSRCSCFCTCAGTHPTHNSAGRALAQEEALGDGGRTLGDADRNLGNAGGTPSETQARDPQRRRRDPWRYRRETLGEAGGTPEDSGGGPPETLCLQVSCPPSASREKRHWRAEPGHARRPRHRVGSPVRHTLRAHGFAFVLGHRFLERPLNRRQTSHRIAPPQRQIAFALVV